MLTKKSAAKVSEMIQKECRKVSLSELCEFWGVTTSEFDEFLESAFKYLDLLD